MPKILPSPFRLREWVLIVTALALAMAALLICSAAGFRSGGMLFLSVVVGTVFFIAISGRHRVFFTTIFTSSLSGGLVVWSMADSLMRRESLLHDDLLLSSMMLAVFYVIIPVAVAWLITFLICRLEKGFQK